MDKKTLTEKQIVDSFILPSIEKSGWDFDLQVKEQSAYTAGRVIVKGKLISRGDKKIPDIILDFIPNLPLAVIEAKDNNHSLGSGMQQGLNYALDLDIPFVYSTNGNGYIEHDRTVSSGKIEKEIPLDKFPSPKELWERYKAWKKISDEDEKLILEEYFFERAGKEPRYYQRIAINRTIEAISKKQKRILLVMATGSGKTFVAFQIIWRLWKAASKKGNPMRILFLADRNILIDDPMKKEFSQFGNKMTKLQNKNDIAKSKAFEMFFGIYQGITSNQNEANEIYKKFSKDFFDLIVIDECHRGSAAAESAWREILEYFNSSVQIGLTATPKETKEVSNIDYFGEPIYTYSLKRGIEDGFLAPYRVIRVGLDRDLEGYRPEKGKKDKSGEEVPDDIYTRTDFDRRLVIDERTEVVAKKISDYLKATDRFSKTIVFCIDIEHAERMRQALVNENSDLVSQHPKYVMRMTGDSEEGKAELENFTSPKERFPVIATTSKLLTTGVDIQTCRLIVLDALIGSMTEFKQIIGRGTRINEDYLKFHFSIIDFRGATDLFADPDFDGDPVQIYEPRESDPIVPPDNQDDADGETNDANEGDDTKNSSKTPIINPGLLKARSPQNKIFINDVEVNIINERVQYIGKDGKLITESLKDYTKKGILEEYKTLSEFLKHWRKSERKNIILKELEAKGILIHELQMEVGVEYDEFDLICHIAFDEKPMTRSERAKKVPKETYFKKYGDKIKSVLDALLDKYSDEGISTIEDTSVLKLSPFNKIGSPIEIINLFGNKEKYLEFIRDVEDSLYKVA
jgi:type I restriction enzyme R subunit